MLQYLIEYKIKSALKGGKSQYEQLKYWLALSNKGVFDPRLCWKYTFADGQSLAEYLLTQSNQEMQSYISSSKTSKSKLFAAQDQLQNYYLLKKLQAKQKPSFEVFPDGFFAKILFWLINYFDWTGKFSSPSLPEEEGFAGTEQKLLDEVLKDGNYQKPWLEEQFRPQELITKGLRLKENFSNPKNPIQEEKGVAKHLRPWLKHLSLQLQIDQNQRYENSINAKQKQVLNAEEQKSYQMENVQWIDNSEVKETYKSNSVFKKANFEYPSMWLASLQHAINDFNKNKGQQLFLQEPGGLNNYREAYNPNFKFYITEEAEKVILAGGNTVRGSTLAMDLDQLPVGFFLDRKGEEWTLKFNADYRNWQLKNLKDADLLMDPYANKLNVRNANKNNTNKTATKDDFLKALEQMNISLIDAHLGLIERIDKLNLYSNKKTQFFAALLMIAKESSHPLHILNLLDKLVAFEKVSFMYSVLGRYDNYPLLYFFLSHHLCRIENGEVFDNPQQMEYLSRLATLNFEELILFKSLTKTEVYRPLAYYNFGEICKGLFYFLDFFKAQGLPLPLLDYAGGQHKGHISEIQDPLMELKGGLDCIVLLENNKNLQKLQLKYFNEIPLDISVAKAQLRAGYNFVHHSMCFDSYYIANATLRAKFKEKYPHLANPFLISPEEFKNLGFPSIQNRKEDAIYFRAAYLRFIALNIDPSAMEAAIVEWEKITGTHIDSCQNLWAGTVDKAKLGLEEDLEFEMRVQKAGSNSSHQTEFYELLYAVKQHWQALKAYALSLPRKNRSEVNIYYPDALANERSELSRRFTESHQYSTEDLKGLLAKISLNEAQSAELCKEVKVLNSLVEKYYSLSSEDLDLALENIQQSALEERIALLREAYRRLSRCEKNKYEGEWLRLEQLVSLLMFLKTPALFQIETGEGKTFIIQLGALLQALDGPQVLVITHNEFLALQASEKLQTLASKVKLRVTNKNDSPNEIEESSIHYIDIANAVLGERLAKLNSCAQKSTKKQLAIIDEVDNVVLDVDAQTTMQISRESVESSSEFIEFLMQLNKVVRGPLVDSKASELAEHRRILRDSLAKLPYYQEQNLDEDENLDFWLKAAVSSMQCLEEIDYIIESKESDEFIRIVHKETTGRVDKVSQWSEAIHQCVSAWERANGHPNLSVPGLSEVIAEGDIAFYLQENFASCWGFTGTIGEEAVEKLIKELLQVELTVKMPRAKRHATEGFAWPKRINLKKPESPPVDCYNRSYHFPPIYTADKEEHFAKILEALGNAHTKELSSIVFFNTINECNEFYVYLLEHNFTKEYLTKYIQILDDTQEPQNTELRPSEETIILRAKEKKMITLATAAGSRGTDFESIELGINAKPGLGRVNTQKSGRIGRNGSLGVFYEIYCILDLDLKAELPATIIPQNLFREYIEQYEMSKQARDLTLISSRAPQREKNQKLQQNFFRLRNTLDADKQKHLDTDWCNFFQNAGRSKAETFDFDNSKYQSTAKDNF